MPGADGVVSVCIPAYQAESFIDRTLHCAREQTYELQRIIVSIDASDDKTEEMCRSHAGDDNRIEVHAHTERLGWVDNINYLARLGTNGVRVHLLPRRPDRADLQRTTRRRAAPEPRRGERPLRRRVVRGRAARSCGSDARTTAPRPNACSRTSSARTEVRCFAPWCGPRARLAAAHADRCRGVRNGASSPRDRACTSPNRCTGAGSTHGRTHRHVVTRSRSTTWSAAAVQRCRGTTGRRRICNRQPTSRLCSSSASRCT